ncbi:fumarylacetoacetate hydrolase family protein [Cohnella sp. AR92]|uniref:fumarylacetoacetate hydrolase family protein n=1 Tax=Cohnella sp. AR92 TaxID=648716 RepID=UPI000F8D097F|nr:fumarylacetoacetate hydrolase family protein [Cohnella sp. AR92]RUS46227.1 fumarylacetoacetate hydrolase family protein [Cohnella sp. AR92]
MGLHIARFTENGNVLWGVQKGDRLLAVEGSYPTLAHFLRSGTQVAREVWQSGAGRAVNIEDVELLSPVTRPARIICQGANYGDHRAESGLEAARPPFNMIFSKADSSLAGPYSDVICPPHMKLLDYEIELGLVIGREIRKPTSIMDANLHEYVAGLVLTNDISARDVQLPQGQWLKGKSYRTFCPTGPYLYLLDAEDVPRIHDLELRLTVNGEIRQHAHTSQLLFKPDETLTELSEIMDLSPGDLILTGTCGGVAMKLGSTAMDRMMGTASAEEKYRLFVESQRSVDRYLRTGDIIRSEIHSSDGRIQLGTQINTNASK